MKKSDDRLPNINYELDEPFIEIELNAAIGSLDRLLVLIKLIITLSPLYLMSIELTLLKIYNDILFEGTIPEQWKQSLMVLILKPDANGFRPICLLSCLSKIMEKMIYNRIQWYIESQHIIPDSQLGFRPDRSCIDSLVILSSEIHKGFISKSITFAAFLDIKGAFDNVITNILVQELENIGIPAKVRMFISNLISSRVLHFVVDGNKQTK